MVALRDQSGPARVRGRDRAMEIPARKVFWEATPVAEVAVPGSSGPGQFGSAARKRGINSS